jgi:hypothetical protein
MQNVMSTIGGFFGLTAFGATIAELSGSPEQWPQLLAQWGLAGVVIGVTLYRDYLREQRMSSALEKQQTFLNDILTKIANKPCMRERDEDRRR